MNAFDEDQSNDGQLEDDGSPDDGGLVVMPAAPETGQDGELDIPDTLPILPVRESVAFPGTVMPLSIGREKSKHVLDLALASDKTIGVFAQRASDYEDPGLDDLYRIGTACRILKMFKLPDGTNTIIIHGLARVGIERITRDTPYLEAKVNHYADKDETSTEIEALAHNVRHASNRVMELSPNVPEEARVVLRSIRTSGALADFLAANLSLSLVHRQELLETFDVTERLRKVYAAISSQLEVLELSSKLHEQVRAQMDKSQREYYLHEQLKAIQAELGTVDARSAEVDRLKRRIAEANLPQPAAEAANREIERLAVIPQASPEYSVSLDYVDWLASLPWSVSTEDKLDLAVAEQVLDADHYGLRKIKRRILEFLAVRKLNPGGKGSILCFAGPPGVGKTSLGQSIARALGRNFIRMSLGGVRDEADIRGHRRTYVGSMPGRIIQELKKAGARNPVFMLDEVDKIGVDFRGDPAAALLEVLDPQQNNTFTDHYLDVPFDLSSVLFIATANYMDMVPGPLRDRMEVIFLSSYTRQEKLHIARNYLVPRQLAENGLAADQVTFTDNAINKIIAGYTREAGVRELERKIGAVCRALAAATVRGDTVSHRVTAETVAEELGNVEYVSEIASREVLAGVVTGLAYTTAGGDILFVEASRMPGSGRLNLTGQIGDVMRESAHAAYTLVRSRSKQLRIKPNDIAHFDLHVHVPAGAVPKDGPSAGVAMLCAIVSAIKNKAVDPKTAMTGEITLRGVVLPVGGIKEKMLAAHRAGIRRIILPEFNKKDLDEIPAEVRDELTFIGAKTVDQVLKAAFSPPVRAAKATKRKLSTSKTPKKAPGEKPAKPARAKTPQVAKPVGKSDSGEMKAATRKKSGMTTTARRPGTKPKPTTTTKTTTTKTTKKKSPAATRRGDTSANKSGAEDMPGTGKKTPKNPRPKKGSPKATGKSPAESGSTLKKQYGPRRRKTSRPRDTKSA
jgi:ATP-dependent Lon protease